MFGFFKTFLSTDSLSPHGICLTWRPELIWTHVASDALIGLAYFSIPIALGVFVSRRRDIVFGWIFWFFAAFILACGTTHFMSIWTLWVPDYGLEALVKAITAILSVGTAVTLWFLLPKAFALPSPAELRQANDALTARIIERDGALGALAKANADREKVEEMLRQSQKMEAIGQFTGGVAHDFNNLLGVIMGNLDRLERRVANDPSNMRCVGDARDAAGRAAIVLQKMLAFARKQPLLPSTLDVNKLVEGMMPLLQRVVLGSKIELDLGKVWDIRVDANQLENALLNLAVNARDAMPNAGTLTIRTRTMSEGANIADQALAPGDYVVLEVQDTGIGMPDAVRERAFEPFFTTKSVGQGTGLGLSQVFGFVTQSGGTVRITSREGYGTSVSLFVPRVSPALNERPAAQTERPVGLLAGGVA